MKDTKDMTNDEFMTHLMTGYSNYGALVQMVILGCLQNGLDQYIENKDEILAEYRANLALNKISFVNMEAWVECCEEVKQRIEEKYS